MVLKVFSAALRRATNEKELQVLELVKENQILHQKNQFVLSQYHSLKGRFEEQMALNLKLQKFEPSFTKLQEKLPNYSVEKLIDRFEYLEAMNMDFARKICEHDDDKLQAEMTARKVKEEHMSQLAELSQKQAESQKFIESLRQQMHTQESELQQDNYKASYFAMFKKVLHIFNLYATKIPVYFGQKDEEQPKANMDDPMEMLELLEKLIAVSSDEKKTAYLRKIIINANSLQRRFFPESVNDRFNPEKIYDRICAYIETLKGDIIKQKTEINNLRVALEKEKSKMNKKCEEKAIVERTKTAKIGKKDVEDDDGNTKRRNALNT